MPATSHGPPCLRPGRNGWCPRCRSICGGWRSRADRCRSWKDGQARNHRGAPRCSASPTRALAYILGPTATSNALRAFVLADRAGATEPRNCRRWAVILRVSPDGTRLAFGTDDGKEANVWIYELSTRAPRRITFSGKNRFPSGPATASGSHFNRIATATSASSGSAPTVPARRNGSPRRAGASHVPESWSRDGKAIVVHRGPGFDIHPCGTLALDDWKTTPFGDVRSNRSNRRGVFPRRPMGGSSFLLDPAAMVAMSNRFRRPAEISDPVGFQ